MKTHLRAAAALVLALSVAGCEKPSDAAFGQKVRAYLLEHPEVLEEAINKLQQNKQLAAAQASKDAVKKFQAQLERDPRDFVANPNGKITVVEFYDYRCGYCKVAAPEVLQIIKENPDVRFVFKEFPIFGGVSDTAARIALTPQVKGKTLALHSSWMAEKALDDAAIDRHLQSLGVDPAAARKAAESPEVAKHVDDIRALAGALQIEGTPAFIIGDVVVPGADMPALRRAIMEAKAGDLKRPGIVKPS